MTGILEDWTDIVVFLDSYIGHSGILEELRWT